MKTKNVKEIGGTLLVRVCTIDRLHLRTSVYLVNRFCCFKIQVASCSFVWLMSFVLVIIEICQKIFSKIEIVDRCNLYCTGKLLQNFEMQKWEKQKAKISQTHQILKEKKSKSPDCAVGSKEYRRI